MSLTLPQGSPVDATSAALEKIEAGAARVRAQLLEETGMDYFRHIATTVGDQPVRARGGAMRGLLQNVAATNVGEITIELAPAETRSYTGEQIGALWREATDPIPEAVELSFDMSVLNVGDDVDLQLTGSDIDRLRAAVEAVKRRLAQYSGVYAIADSFRSGTLEMHLDIEPTAENLGLRLGDLGRQVRQAFYGEEAQRIQRGRDDIRVMVRYPRDDRRSLGDLEDMRIRTPEGGEVPFGYVARGELVRGFASITRVDRNRTVNVTASVDPAISSPGPVITDLETRVLPELNGSAPPVFILRSGKPAPSGFAPSCSRPLPPSSAWRRSCSNEACRQCSSCRWRYRWHATIAADAPWPPRAAPGHRDSRSRLNDAG